MSRLSDLDARLVPRLALALRSLLDGVSSRQARAKRAVLVASGRRPMRRPERRSGPLALLRDVPQLGLLLVATVFLAGAGVALARNSSSDVADREQVVAELALPLELGPPAGTDVDDHFLAARERVVDLADDAPDDRFLALVSLRDELTADETGQLVEGSGLAVRRAYVRAPVGEAAEVLPLETPGTLARDLEVQFADTAARRATEQRELLRAAESITSTAAVEQAFKQQFEADAALKGREADAYRSTCACVLAVVVEGTARELAELPSMAAVRGLEIARRGAVLPALRIDPLPPEVTGVRPSPVQGR